MEEAKDQIRSLWHRYEIPVILVGSAFAVLVFIYTNFLTKNDGEVLNLRITSSNEARIRENEQMRSDIKERLDSINAAVNSMAALREKDRELRDRDRELLSSILSELKKK